MFSMITNIYSKKTKGPTLMELFTATVKLKKVFFDNYRCSMCAPWVTRHTSIWYSSCCHMHISVCGNNLNILVNDQHDAQILFYVFISIYDSLHVSSTSCSSSGETNCINTASGNSHSMLVADMCACWKKIVLIKFVSPDDEHDVLETCREL
jgi:hypothetical protein